MTTLREIANGMVSKTLICKYCHERFKLMETHSLYYAMLKGGPPEFCSALCEKRYQLKWQKDWRIAHGKKK